MCWDMVLTYILLNLKTVRESNVNTGQTVHVMTYASVIGVSCHYPFTSRHVTPMPAKVIKTIEIKTRLFL
jgi:hypothetical protein